ncbi:GAF domain-containing sensor histidine kinase [Dactylosporangium sp. NPDC049140]|uniref:GAF domain-containing sensor histidine kinase n=1 Tax=Dactylosporangium sp. NPDC049140 TaxID=3155647 RepID=UPI0033F6D4ED
MTAATDRWAITATVTAVAGLLIINAFVVVYLKRAIVWPVRRATGVVGQLAHSEPGSRLRAEVGEAGKPPRPRRMMGGSVRHNVEELVRFGKAQAALRRIATCVARGAAPAEVLDAVATELGWLIRTDGAHIVRYEHDGTATVVAAWGASSIGMPVGARFSLEGRSVSAQVFRTGRTARMDGYADVPGPLAAHLRQHAVRSAAGAPIVVDGRLWGAVIATVTQGPPLALDSEVQLADYTDLIATAIANTQTRADLAASRARVVVAADQARRQIERNLHDGIQQHLIALAIEAGDVAASIPGETPELRRRLATVAGGLNGVLDDLREISRGIHPTMLSDRGLRPALRGLARRCNIPVELDTRLEGRLPEPVEVAAYHIVAEAVTNAAKHAHASHVSVDAAIRAGRFHLIVRDDGIGGADPACGSGLLGLLDRVDALGGSFTISSPPGRGTSLQAELPVDLARLA